MGRDLDVVVFGATGDTGVCACACLYFKGRQLGISSWAPAARNLGKLKKDVLDRLSGVQPGAEGIQPAEPIEADSNDYESLVKMCSRAKCVIACAGPYAQYGEGVVRACAEAGTNYVDVTGETPWVEKMAGKYGAQARAKGVSMVSCAGYDSVPPDITAYLAAKALEKEGDQLQRYEAFCGGSGGALPTGTLETVLAGVEAGKDSFLRTVTFGALGQKPKKEAKAKEAAPPPAAGGETFLPKEERAGQGSSTFWSMCPGFSSLGGQFCIGHFMAPINTVTVHHTAAKEGYGGPDFVYRERMHTGAPGPLSLFGFAPMMMGIGTALVLSGLVLLPGFCSAARWFRDTFNPPLTAKVRQCAFDGFRPTGATLVTGYGLSKSGRQVNVSLHSSHDPGLCFTMLSACTVAAQIAKRSGTSSPATPGYSSATVALGGDAFADALRAAGVALDVKVQSKL